MSDERRLQTAQEFFSGYLGKAEHADREAEIEGLPTVEWKGRILRTVRCTGTTGKGPHDYNVPEAVLWSLMDLTRFLCPFHR